MQASTTIFILFNNCSDAYERMGANKNTMQILEDFFAQRHDPPMTREQHEKYLKRYYKTNLKDEDRDRLIELVNEQLPVTSPDGIAHGELFHKRLELYNKLKAELLK